MTTRRNIGKLLSGGLCLVTTIGSPVLLGNNAVTTGTDRTDRTKMITMMLPVKKYPRGQKPALIEVFKNGELISKGALFFAKDDPDCMVGADITGFGPAVTVRINGADYTPELKTEFAHVYGGEKRPRFHFTSMYGWLNDPNGLVYHEGVWHLFYQHNPYGVIWGNMHWGHATSIDLIHWQQQPIAIRPLISNANDQAFSGSAFFDKDNSLQLDGGPALIAVYTSTGRGQCLIYSHDNGVTWKDYEHNPVLVHGNSNRGIPGSKDFYHDSRDPKIFRYKDQHWVMLVYEQNTADKKYKKDVTFAIYISSNLKDWTRTQVLEGWYECGEMFELPVDGDYKNTKWVVLEAHGYYAIGKFDGKTFVPDPRTEYTDQVKNSFRPYICEPYKYQTIFGNVYAGQCWSNIPLSDGRQIYIGWLRGNSLNDTGFSQAMTVPSSLSLKTTEQGVRLFFSPVRELDKLEEKVLVHNFTSGSKAQLTEVLGAVKVPQMRIRGTIQFDPNKKSTLTVNKYSFTYNPENHSLNKNELALKSHQIEIDLLVDRGTVELFVNGGRYYFADAYPFVPDKLGISAENITVKNLFITELGSIWE